MGLCWEKKVFRISRSLYFNDYKPGERVLKVKNWRWAKHIDYFKHAQDLRKQIP